MKPERLVLISYGIWLLSVVVICVHIELGDWQSNLLPGYPLVVNAGSISLVLGLMFAFLVAQYLSAVGRATGSSFSWLVAMLIISVPPSVLYWADIAWVVRAIVFLLVVLALEFYWPNWIWELRRRLSRKSV
jgi:hypothetical protein